MPTHNQFISESKAKALRLIRDLRGAPITVLFTLWVLGGAQGWTEEQIAFHTGYRSVQTVRAALRQLSREGLAIRARLKGGWVLTKGGLQLALAFGDGDKLGKGVDNLAEGVDNPVDRLGIAVDNPTGTGKNYLNQLLVVSPSLDSESRDKDSRLLDSQTKNTGGAVIREMLAQIEDEDGEHIGEPALTRLATSAWVTEDYIARHVAKWQKGKTADERQLRLLIWRMTNNKPAPLSDAEKQARRDARERGKYVEGDFSDFIER